VLGSDPGNDARQKFCFEPSLNVKVEIILRSYEMLCSYLVIVMNVVEAPAQPARAALKLAATA
jgi:hypothetical protein